MAQTIDVDLMLRARALALKPRTLKNLQQQEELYRQALTLEPDNANAMTGLPSSLVLQPADFESQLAESDLRISTEGNPLGQSSFWFRRST